MKIPLLNSTLLSSKLAVGLGHNYYGEPAWPNDILYVFPIVILGMISIAVGLSVGEPLGMGLPADPFATPLEILPEWYFFATFNLLRVLPDKFIGAISILSLPLIFLSVPFLENTSVYQNPFRRPIMMLVFLTSVAFSLWLSMDL